MISHIVIFKLRLPSEVDERSFIIELKTKLEALPHQIEDLIDLKVGLNINPMEESSFALIATTKDLNSLDNYANHPLHTAIVSQYIKPYLISRTCVDHEL